MKRPLLLVASVLFLGIFLLNLRADTRKLLLYDRPDLAVYLESSESGFLVGELRGTIKWIFKKNGKQVLKVDGGEYGTVYCYLEEEELLPASYIGAEVKLDGSFFLFQSAENPGQFDCRTYYENLGIYLGFSVTDKAVLNTPEFVPKRAFYRIYRTAMVELSQYFQEADLTFFTTLLTTSSQEEESMRDLLSVSYLSSLLTTSGILVSAIGLAIYQLLKKFVENKWIRATIPVALMVCYCYVVASPLSLMRAIFLFSLKVFAPAFRRTFDILTATSCLVIVLIFTRPTYVLLPAIWYYFAVVYSVGIVYPLLKRLLKLRSGLYLYSLLSLSLSAAFLPITLYTSFGVNLIAPILTAILLPLKTIAVVSMLLGLILYQIIPVSQILRFFFGFSHYLRLFIEQLTEAVQSIPFLSICTGKPSIIRILIYELLYAGVPITTKVFLEVRKRKKESDEVMIRTRHKLMIFGCLATIYLFGLFFLHAHRLSDDEVRYVQLSIGQGDSEVVMSKGFTLVVDCGSSSEDNPGEILENALKYYGITHVDVMILTHADDDHTNGVIEFFTDGTMTLDELWLSGVKEEIETYKEKLSQLSIDSEIRYVFAGVHYEKNDASITVLYPKKNTEESGNDASVVCTFEKDTFSALLCGDISEECEDNIYLNRTYFTIYKVAHHGSKYSSSESFLSRFTAEYAFCSAGKNNTYGHPHAYAVARIKARGSAFYCTSTYGAIELTIRNGKKTLRTYSSK